MVAAIVCMWRDLIDVVTDRRTSLWWVEVLAMLSLLLGVSVAAGLYVAVTGSIDIAIARTVLRMLGADLGKGPAEKQNPRDPDSSV